MRAALLLLLLCLAGCDRMPRQESPEVATLEASLDGTPRTAEIHFQLGLLYDEKIPNPAGAVHHYQRYLELTPDGPHAKEARSFLQENQLKLATQLGDGAFLSQAEARRLKNANQELQKRNLQLQTDLEAARKTRR